MLLRSSLHLLFLLLLCLPASAQTSFNFRTVNLIEGAGAVDVHFGDRETPSISGLAYGTVSSLLKSLPAIGDMFNVKVTPSGSGLAGTLVGADVEVLGNREYVAVAYGTSGAAEMRVLERNRGSFPAVGKTHIRLLNAASILEPLDLYIDEVGTTPAVANVAPDSVSRFVPVENTSSTLLLTVAGSTVPVRRVVAPFGQATPFMTVIVTGSTTANLQVWILTISVPPEETGSLVLLDEASYTDVRVVNLRPGASENPQSKYDIYLNSATKTDQKVADTLRYREATRNLGPLIADSLRLKFVTGGDPSSQPLFTVNSRFENDTAYVVALTQFKDLRPTTIVLKRSPVAPLPPGIGTTLARFVNATDFYGPLSGEIIAGEDTVRFSNLGFRESTTFERLPVGEPLSVRVFRQGVEGPIYDRPYQGGRVPGGAYLTLFAVGTSERLSVDLLNESQPGRQPLTSFDEGSGVPVVRNLTASLAVYPNPVATGSGRVSVVTERSAEAEFVVVDMLGRVVDSFEPVRVDAGQTTLHLPLDRLSEGAYTLVMRIDGETAGATAVVVVR